MPQRTKRSIGGLTERELIFCHELIALKGAQTKAAVAAGYSPRSAACTASKLMRRPEILAKVEQLSKKYLKNIERRGEDVLHELTVLAHADIGEVMKWDKNGVELHDSEDLGDVRRAVKAVKFREYKDGRRQVEVEMHSKIEPLTRLGQNLRLLDPDTTVNNVIVLQQEEAAKAYKKRIEALKAKKP